MGIRILSVHRTTQKRQIMRFFILFSLCLVLVLAQDTSYKEDRAARCVQGKARRLVAHLINRLSNGGCVSENCQQKCYNDDGTLRGGNAKAASEDCECAKCVKAQCKSKIRKTFHQDPSRAKFAGCKRSCATEPIIRSNTGTGVQDKHARWNRIRACFSECMQEE